MQKNTRAKIEITGLSHEGSGVGRIDGVAVFVPRTAPGDTAVVKLTRVLASHAFGRLEEIITPSAHRVPDDCPAFARCGGCSLRHISYPAELAAKASLVRENFGKIAKLPLEWGEIIPSPKVERYRNKAVYPVRLVAGRVRTGFFAPRSHTLIPVDDCLLQPVFFSDICREITDFCEVNAIPPYDETTHTGLLRNIYIRYAETSSQTLIVLVINGQTLPGAKKLAARLVDICPGEISFQISRNCDRTNVILGRQTRHVVGLPVIEDTISGVRIQLSPQSFYQVNRPAAELLYDTAAEYAAATPGQTLLDLYCGVGAIGLSMAGSVDRLIGVESVGQAVEDAVTNARINGFKSARFIRSTAGQAFGQLRGEGILVDTIIVDPPRKGLDRETIEQVTVFSPGRIVYISCNIATLARDCALFADRGYLPVRGQAVDLFPRTAHTECAVLLEKNSQ